MSDVSNLTPPEPPVSREIGEQDGDQILDPIVNDPAIKPQSVGGVLDDASISGNRSLGGMVQSRMIAANVQSLEFTVDQLKAEVTIERDARHKAELKLSKIEGTESNSWPQKVLGGIVAAIGALIMTFGISYEQAEGFSFSAAPSLIGFSLLVTGYIFSHWRGASK